MWKTFLSFLFPKYCVSCKKLGNYICDNCFSYIQLTPPALCGVCKKRSLSGITHATCKSAYSIDGVISAVEPSRVIKRLLYSYTKVPYVSDLTQIIGSLCVESLEHNQLFYSLIKKKNLLCIPLPLSSQEYRKRGYNQSSLLCSYVAQYFKLKYVSDLLIQRRLENRHASKHVSSHSFREVDHFYIEENLKPVLKNAIVIIVGDMIAPSTLREMSKALKIHGVKSVWAVVFTQAQKTQY